mmetsp:Transcript_40379/g.93666  ORF Transcript_40379/g.93666 Transcript_40379/m.93666 type:complete len:345 (-) Transcript_40379:63-1097(-)
MAPCKAGRGKKVSSPKYRKFWDGSRPQVWIVSPHGKGVGRGVRFAAPQFISPFAAPALPQQAEPPNSSGKPIPEEEPAHSETFSVQIGSLWSEGNGSSNSAPSKKFMRDQDGLRGPPLPSELLRLKPSSMSRAAGSCRVHTPTKRKNEVLPPWSAERANRDRPPWEIHVQKQMEYRQILDEQTASQADQRRRRHREVVELEKRSIPSLATKTHVWENKDTDSNAKALMEEQLAAAAVKKGQELQRRQKEEETCRRWLEKAAVERAERYVSTRQRLREEVSVLTDEWARVAEEKRQQREEKKRAELNEEQEALRHLTRGLVPPRRLRKPCSPYVNEVFDGAKTAR